MKKIIVTGCNGQLGRAINLELKGNSEIEFVNTDVAELDITNIDKVMGLAREVKPYAIINCAAHTGVDACETDIDNAYRINAIGPRNLSIAATETGAKMVHISTDYVFDGMGTRPYLEFDRAFMVQQSWWVKIWSRILQTDILFSERHGYTETGRILSRQCLDCQKQTIRYVL